MLQTALVGQFRIFQEISGCDPLAESLYEQLSEIENLLNDFNHELSAARNSVEFSPEEFQEVEIRLNEINRLKIQVWKFCGRDRKICRSGGGKAGKAS